MSKITFRADDELIQELEAFDASKSEVMRRALRSYLDAHDESDEARVEDDADAETEATSVLDDTVEERIVELVDERVERLLREHTVPQPQRPQQPAQDINLTIDLDGESATADVGDARKTTAEGGEDASDHRRSTCPQCGEGIESDDVYCPNCGTKSSHRVFCECGDEIRSDWGFCPSCGRRTPAADVLDGP